MNTLNFNKELKKFQFTFMSQPDSFPKIISLNEKMCDKIYFQKFIINFNRELYNLVSQAKSEKQKKEIVLLIRNILIFYFNIDLTENPFTLKRKSFSLFIFFCVRVLLLEVSKNSSMNNQIYLSLHNDLQKEYCHYVVNYTSKS